MANQQNSVNVLNQAMGKNFSLFNGDCVEVLKGIPDNSIDLTVSSLPFSNLYLYSPSARDMGNTEGNEHFFSNFNYLVPELLRVTTPGRLCVMHCKDLPLFMGSDGSAGLYDFPGDIVRSFVGDSGLKTLAQIDVLKKIQSEMSAKAIDTSVIDREILELQSTLDKGKNGNWVFHSRVTIWKCPKIEMERTNNHGLLHKQLCKDSSASRQGMADYLLVFRKWSDEMHGLDSTKPVAREKNARFSDYIGEEPPYGDSASMTPRDYSIHVWRKYASPTWHDIQQTKVLNARINRAEGEPHICPLQLDVIGRCIELWSNPGDVVLDPFSGLGSTGYQALKMNRRYVGVELKKEYYKASIDFLTESDCTQQLQLTAV